MIIVKIMGGLGNQMFQYALGKNLALLNKVEVKFDITWFDNFGENTTPRYYSLQEFNIIDNIASRKEIEKFRKYEKLSGKRHFLYNFFIANDSIYIKEKKVEFDKEILEIKNNVYLFGYWQSEKYFKTIKDIILKELTLKNEPSNHYKKNAQLISQAKNNSISIHIRRGDYTSEKLKKDLGLCSLQYYKKALEKIKKKVKNPVIFVFTNDIKWAKNNLKFKYPINFVSQKNKNDNNYKNKDYEELILISLCKHNIIANSSFSWWGAWLNKNINKIVIAPKIWFKKQTMNTKDIPLKSWIQI